MTTEFTLIPAGTAPVDALVKDFEACAEGGMAQRSLIADVRAFLAENGENEKALFQVAQSYAVASAKWDTMNPLKNFADGRDRNKAKNKALQGPMGYLNREVIRPLGSEIKKTKEGYGLKPYDNAPDTAAQKRSKALKALEDALKRLNANKTNKGAVAKLVEAWENQAA